MIDNVPSIYNQPSVYNQGGGGGGIIPKLPDGFKKCKSIKFKQAPGGVTHRFFWLPISNCVYNENVLFIIDYTVNLKVYENSIIFTTVDYPGDGGNVIDIEIRRESNDYSTFHHIKNTNNVFPTSNWPLSITTERTIIGLYQSLVYHNWEELYNNPSMYYKSNIENARCAVLTDGSNLSQMIHEVQIRKGGAIMYDYIPCVRLADNVIGFFDLINQQFIRTTEQNENEYYEVGN